MKLLDYNKLCAVYDDNDDENSSERFSKIGGILCYIHDFQVVTTGWYDSVVPNSNTFIQSENLLHDMKDKLNKSLSEMAAPILYP